MIYEQVNFNEEEVSKMSPEEFEDRHLQILWPDRDEETRKKMLAQVYGLINPKNTVKKKPGK